MKLSLNNFFKMIREVVTGDPGFLVDHPNLIGSSVLATSVTRITDANSFPVLNAAASITAVANVSFMVPRDYDEATDTLYFRIVAKMAGATDVPTLTLVAKKQTVGGAATTLTISAADTVAGTVASPTAALSATDQAFVFKFVGQGLVRNTMVNFLVTSAAHTTDAIQVKKIGVTYHSTLVSYGEGTVAVPLR